MYIILIAMRKETILKPETLVYWGKKVYQLVKMGFLIGNLFSIRALLLASTHTYQLFENDFTDTRKRSKETNYDFIGRIWSA